MSAQPRAERFVLPPERAAIIAAPRPGSGALRPLAPADGPAGAALYCKSLKRGLDIFLVVASLPVVLPLVAVLALAIALQGGRPFYTQARVGRGGRIFRMWKLRTMVPDADRQLEAHLARDPGLRAEWDAHQKLKRDPRITAFGQFLRKSSLDELPQLWNILKGDMSIVGPRPMMPEQRPLYPGTAYYRMRPGLTGFWQISDRNDSFFAHRAECDTDYERNVSLLVDLRVILQTAVVVMRGTGY